MELVETLLMVHRGLTVERVVRQSGFKISELSHRLNLSRSTLYRRFAEENLSFDFILLIGKIINYDFTSEFEEMGKDDFLSKFIEADPSPVPTPGRIDGIPAVVNELIEVQRKYIQLLERHNRFVEDWILDHPKESKG